MTFVCAWKDATFGYDRIVVLADSLITVEPVPNVVQPMANRAVKIMKITARCFRQQDLGIAPNPMAVPWFSFEVGLAYTGYCLEALYIAELARRCFDNLFKDERIPAPPSLYDLSEMLAGIAKAYFSGHAESTQQIVTFFMFGHCPQEDRLKIIKVECKGTAVVRSDLCLDFPLHWIGQAVDGHDDEIHRLLNHLQRRYKRLPKGIADDLRLAKEELAKVAALVWNIEHQISDDGPLAVGGTVQAAEAFLHDGRACVALNDSMAGLLPSPPGGGGWQPLIPKDALLRRQQWTG